MFQRRTQYQALAKETETLAVPTVAVIRPMSPGRQEDLVLPGNAAGVCGVADLRADKRILEEVVSRHRQPSDKGESCLRI